jgi:LemA protein
MEQNGVITPEQASLLRQGLRPLTGTEAGKHARSRSSVRVILLSLLAVTVIAVGVALIGGGNGGEIDTVANVINQPGGTGDMNQSLSGVLALGLVFAVLIIVGVFSFNGLVSKEEAAFGSWAQVESTLQRRADLIPALVETVSGYVEHEQDTLLAVTQARSAAIGRVAGEQAALRNAIDAVGELEDDATMLVLQQASARLNGSLADILALAEDYPDLRASDQFLELQAQLEGTENRINVARMRFNETVEEYNRAIRRIPGSVMASLGGFRRKAYFTADDGAETRPGISF